MWFTETPWPPIVILSVVAVALLLAWSANRRIAYLLAAMLSVLAGVGVYFVEQSVVTERERVEATIHDFVHTFRDESATYNVTSPAPLGGEVKSIDFVSSSAPLIRTLVWTGLNVVKVEDVRITDLDVTMTSENSRAVTHFRANATISVTGYGNLGRKPSRWELTWQKEANDWRVIRARRLNPITGEEYKNPLTARE